MADEIINIPNNLREYLSTFGSHTNLNDTTPAAPSGDTNVTWQEDEFGNISAYVPTSGGGGGGNTTSTALTTNTLPKASGTNSIVDSSTTDDGTTLTMNSPAILAGASSIADAGSFFNITYTPTVPLQPTYTQALNVAVVPNFGSDQPSQNVNGLAFAAVSEDTFALESLIGITGAAIAAGSGAIRNVLSGDFSAHNDGTSTVGSLVCLKPVYANTSTGTVVDAYGIHIESPSNDAGNNNITNAYGMFIQPQDCGTNKYNLYSQGPTTKNAIEGGIVTNQAGNTDLAGVMVAVAGTATYAFQGTYATPPVVVVNNDTTVNGILTKTITTTSITVTTSSPTDSVSYICVGRT